MNFLYQLAIFEESAFLAINHSHNNYFDALMWIFSSKIMWIPFAIITLSLYIYKNNWKEILLFVCSILVLFILCDKVPAQVIRPFFHRPRPTHFPTIENLVLTVRNYRGGQYGFFSNHASNGMGIITLTALIFKNRYYSIIGFLWLIIIMYSRVYLGVHFISDTLGGALWGGIMGLIIYKLYNYFRKIYLHNAKTTSVSQERVKLITLSIVGIIFCSTISAFFLMQ